MTNKRGRALITQIATGRNHVLALDTEGNVYSWGNNKFGQLGIGQSDSDEVVISRSRPEKIEGELTGEVSQIYAGNKQSFAVTRQGKVFCWGDDSQNLLGFAMMGKKNKRVN